MLPPVKKYSICAYFSLDSDKMTFSTEKAKLWTEDSLFLAGSSGLKLKPLNWSMDLFVSNTQLFTSQDINWWTEVVWITCVLLWCFYQLFELSFWQHPFTAEDPLVSKWCKATFLQIWYHAKTNSSVSWMAWGIVHFQNFFLFLELFF